MNRFPAIFYLLFQVMGENSTTMGRSSRRPASISNIRTYFDKRENMPKLDAGPTMDRPGPILLIVAAIAVKFVVKSKLSRLTSSREPT